MSDIANGLPGVGAPQLSRHDKTMRTLGDIAGIIGDGLLGYAGMKPEFAPALQAQQQDERQQGFDLQKLNFELAAKREEALRPRMEQVGNTIGLLDPAKQSYTPTYTAPSPAEEYASALGFEPGSDEYKSAVKDYRLGSWSDPAMDNRLTLEGVRFGDRRTLQNDRLAVTRRGQDLNHTDRQAAIGQSNTNNLRSTSQSNTNNLRTTQTSRENNVQNSFSHLRTSKKGGMGNIVQVGSPEEAQRLPVGTPYMRPDGVVMTR